MDKLDIKLWTLEAKGHIVPGSLTVEYQKKYSQVA